MIVHETGGVQGPQPVQPNRPPVGKAPAAQPASSARGGDRAEISDQARFLAKLRGTDAVRQEKIDSIREQIEAGTYETEDKLEAAIERLLDDLR